MNRPNILIFMPDQMHRETIGPGGLCTTPNFNALAQRGVTFSHAFTPTPICTPARASALTGLLPHQHTLLHNSHMIYPKQENLPKDITTFGEELEQAGYTTFYTGKWHVGSSKGPQDHGFNRVGSIEAPARCDPRFVTQAITIPNRSSEKNVLAATTSEPREQTQPWRICQSAAQFIRQHREDPQDRPFLVFASTDVPHVPWFTPHSYANRYDARTLAPWPNYGADLTDKPACYRDHYNGWDYCQISDNWPLVARALAHYYGMITLIDDAFGLIIEALRDADQLDNTLIIVTSDHGEFMGRHGLFGKNEMLSDDLVRIPLIASWPARWQGNRQRHEMVTLCDLYPTLLETAGVTSPPNRTGRSLAPLLDDAALPPGWPEQILLEHHGDLQYNVVRAVRDRHHKYVYWANDCDELYDLGKDPGEVRNLARHSRHAAIRTKYQTRLLQLMTTTNDPFLRGTRSNLESEMIANRHAP